MTLEGEQRLTFDLLHPSNGTGPGSPLPLSLGVSDGDGGKVDPAAPLGGPSPGVFVDGDIVEGPDPISVAFGHGDAARTHNLGRLDA